MKTIDIYHKCKKPNFLYESSVIFKVGKKIFAEVYIYKDGMHSLTINKCINYKFSNFLNCISTIENLAEMFYNSKIQFNTVN